MTCSHTMLENFASGDQRERPRRLASPEDGRTEGLSCGRAGEVVWGWAGGVGAFGVELAGAAGEGAGARAASAAWSSVFAAWRAP